MSCHLLLSIPHYYLVQTSLENSLKFKEKQENVPKFVSYYFTIFGQKIYIHLYFVLIFRNVWQNKILKVKVSQVNFLQLQLESFWGKLG